MVAGLDGSAVAERGAGKPQVAELGVDVALRGGVVGVHEGERILFGGIEPLVVPETDLDAGSVAGPGLLAAVVEGAGAGDVAAEDDVSARVDAAVGVDPAGEGHRRPRVDLQVALVERGVVAERGPLHGENLAQNAGDAGLRVSRAGDDLDLLAPGRRGAGVERSGKRHDEEPQLEVRVWRFGLGDAVAADVEALDAAVREQGPHGHHAVAKPGLGRDERPLHDELPPRERGGADGEPRKQSGGEADRKEQHEDHRQDDAAARRAGGAPSAAGGGAVRRHGGRRYSNETAEERFVPGGPSTIT